MGNVKKLPLNDLKWVEDISDFDNSLINCYKDEGYFLEVDIPYPESLHTFVNDSPFLPERMKNKKSSKLCN